MSPNSREIDEAIFYIKDARDSLDDYKDGYVDKVAIKEALNQALEFLGYEGE